MKKFVLGSLALAAMLATPAMAADMPIRKAPPPLPIYDWSGFYVGAHAGWLWGDTDWHYENGIDLSRSADHGLIGLHFGAQYQVPFAWGGVVLGVEASLSGPFRENKDDFSQCEHAVRRRDCGIWKFDDIATVGGRLGLAFDRFLFAVSGGWASAEIHTRAYLGTPEPGPQGSIDFIAFSSAETHRGWYVGASAEFMVHRGPFVDVIAGIDFQHIELDEETHRDVNRAGLPFGPGCTDISPDPSFRNVRCKEVNGEMNVVRARLTIKTPGFGFLWPAARP